jgi:hypothetical protein
MTQDATTQKDRMKKGKETSERKELKSGGKMK